MQRKMHKIALTRTWNFYPKILFLIFDTHSWESKPIYLFLTVFYAIIYIHAINIEGLRIQELLGYFLRFMPLCSFWISFWPHDRVQKLWLSQICKFYCISYEQSLNWSASSTTHKVNIDLKTWPKSLGYNNIRVK